MKTIDCKQYSSEWWEARKGVPTASNFHRIITPAKWEYASGAATYMQELIAERYDPMYGNHEEYVSHAMARGTHMEPEARRFYEFSRDVEVSEAGFLKTDDERFGCSPDAMVGEEGGLELKSPAAKTQVKWLLSEKVPVEHLAQCHGFLLVTGRDWIDFLSYCPPLPELLVRVVRDEKTDALQAALDKFWGQYLVAQEKITAHRKPTPTRTTVIAGMEVKEGIHAAIPF